MKKLSYGLLFILCLLFVCSCGKTNTTTKPRVDPTYGKYPSEITIDQPQGDYQLFSSKEEIINYFNNSSSYTSSLRKNASGGNSYFDVAEDIAYEANPSPTNAEPGSSEAYQTNNQVSGVDEADLIKVKDNKVCYLSNNVLFLLEYVDGTLKVINKIKFEEREELVQEEENAKIYHHISDYAQDLFLSDRYVVVRYSTYEYDQCTIKEDGNTSTSSANYQYSTNFKLFDINTLQEVKTIKTSGNNVSLRLIDNDLYVVNNYTEFLRNHYLLPYYGIDDVLYEASIDHIAYCPSFYNAYYFVSIYKINLGSEIDIQNLHVASPYIDNLYVNEDNIYLINSWSYQNIREDNIEYQYPTSKVLVINTNSLQLVGDFTTIGTISDRYWIDEVDGYIRTVTTGRVYKTKYYFNRFPFYSADEIFNYLTIYQITDDGIKQVSMIKEGIGKPGESIRSARFNGDVVTVVTFVNTDPIYYIDLSDPLNPVITSAFEISGYSVYQLPYLDHYVIGFGYEVEDNRTIGYKITLFDISNKEVKAVGNSYTYLYTNTNNRYSYVQPDFIYNPKAMLVDLSHDFFGYHEYEYNYSNYNSRYIERYVLFHIDPLSADPIQVILKEETNYNSNNSLCRMIYINDDYYLFDVDKVLSYKREGAKLVPGQSISLY